jgi:hypothetical protein
MKLFLCIILLLVLNMFTFCIEELLVIVVVVVFDVNHKAMTIANINPASREPSRKP